METACIIIKKFDNYMFVFLDDSFADVLVSSDTSIGPVGLVGGPVMKR
jgi:small nuclear ribonucleoprotein (snRNP)-like protein